MKDSKRFWVWVGVLVVVLAVVLVFAWKPASKQAPSGPVPVYAPQGQLVPQFPASLILDSNAAISGSYSINYSSSTNQYTAEYDSSSTMADLFAKYQAYLPQNNWTVIGTITTHPTFEEISATQGVDQLQIVIGVEGKGSQVIISYAAH
jgi:hypothetical protein